ncbi:unnamed protein product [Penicillium salamii]|uniref:HSF-type DNA-binding domain-containing protein n=1 Tax=Penicillium salamii TaxID=1612424 RepID=A0A9W4K604_9EURO|nr:unnamed protein product [Penicillium salamii]CAG8429021.1 unnamed protein product [Penicillium salamii]CAG8431806.1 unnamed protein product [Penicillium salamii]CAG8598492.1 unnamed protein product [Penicillium salamii]CAG8891534.1 unnamed protein product [Penicillium salamii]
MASSPQDTSNVENFQTIKKIFDNFIPQHHDKSLSALKPANIPLSEFSANLRKHLSVLNEGGSIARGGGEDLVSTGLSKSLDSLFSTTTPFVTEGPPLTWTSLVLFAGHQFGGPAQLQVGDSKIELSGEDFKLLRSGRPWRFLYPWPDKDDCAKELQSTKTAIQELLDARKMINEVLGQISLVEQHLHDHYILVSRLSKTKHDFTQHEGLHYKGVESSIPTEGVFEPGASPEDESSGHRDSTSAPMAICHVSHDQSAQQVNGEVNDPSAPEDLATRNNQQDVPCPGNDVRPGFRLHTSDFVQSLSEILDDPENGEVMRWSEDGHSVFIGPENKVPSHILEKMSTKSYQSLIRRLYYFGFRKIGGVYHHDSFIRGRPSSIQPTREMIHSPSLPSPTHNSSSQRGPRFKVIKRTRTRESV